MADIGVVGKFVANHPEFAPELLEGTLSVIQQSVRTKRQKLTLENMEAAWAEIVAGLKTTLTPEELEKVTVKTDADVEKYREQINAWSSDEMREFCKDPAVLAAVEAVLSQPRSKKTAPAPEPKAEIKAPVKSAEEIAIDRMSADQFKAAIAKGGARARGIENTLADAAKRRAQ